MADEFVPNPDNSSTSPAPANVSRPNPEPVRIIVSGSRSGIRVVIHTLFKCGFAQVDEWSKLQAEPHTHRLMSVMTKHIRVDERTEGQGTS
ncbi:MAG: hypothetical protein AAF821_08025 [Cyanobacteria bacterium P01_D01_bin.156]